MIRTLQGVTLLIVLAAGVAFAQPQTSAQYSHAELQKMIAEAHTPQQYQTLATYFRSRQQMLEQQAQSEKLEWDRRSQIAAASYQKYPRPADSSRDRYEYFTYEAQQMGQQAAHFESLAAPVQP
jgi:hypothetical protein